ncbi:MAG: MATE family efflux transporter [Coriobacteriia bacterium]|nr:MATE family efflux transporter [Coriobacteriia bacterium]
MVEFAIPSIIGLIVSGLYNIINSIFLGQAVGPVGLAVSTISMPIMIFSMSVGVLIGTGGNALIALRLGEGKHKDAEKILGNALTLTIIASVLCTVGTFAFEDVVLRLSGATEEVWHEASIFIRIIAAGFIFQFFSMGFNNYIRTAGDPNRALYTMVAGTVICIILNFFFVMVLDWGVTGSALATLLGQAFSAVLVFWYFVFSRKAPFKIRVRNLPLKLKLVRSILVLGSAAFVLQIASAVVNLIINYQLVALGALSPIGSEGALATIGVVNRVAMFTLFPIMGVAIAAQPIFGYNYGAKNFKRVIKTFQVALVWIIVIGAVFWILVHLIPGPIVRLFGVEDDLLAFTTKALIVQLFLIPVMGLQVLGSNYFQASGQPLKSMYLSLTRQILYLIPLIFLMPVIIPLLIPSAYSLEGLYYAFPVADALSVITAAIFVAFEFKKLKVRIREQETSS